MPALKTTLGLLAAVTLTSAAVMTACSSNSAKPGDVTDASEAVGSIGLDLQVAPGFTLATVSYTITGPSAFSKSGTIDVSKSGKIAATISPLPVGQGYSITLSANSVEGGGSCSGSASFDITARQTTPVTVAVMCHEIPHTGSALVNGQLNVCPLVDGVAASPGEVIVGGTIALAATAHDSDAGPSALSYHWTASSGTLSSATVANPTFTCTAPGSVTLTVSASDGDPAASCADTGSVTVQCSAAGATSACTLGKSGAIKHVIYIQFDNTHLTRDRAAVPSDLEQMPHLLSFIRGNGTIMANDHTVLISHTAGGILSSLTGVYPDRNGQTVSNSYVRTSDTGTFQFPSSFGYWTDPASATTNLPNMVGPDGSNIPAPWVNYTRAGCDFGAVASANVVLENTGVGVSGDVTKVFGAGSPQFAEATASAAAASGSAARNLAQTDLVGFAVHCAKDSPTCSNGQADLLPGEPGGYAGFKGLFGAQSINPLLTGQPPSVAVTDLLGHPVVDPFNQPGFPGFDGMSAAVSLSYIANMQEKGIPVTYAYISDAHDFHGVSGNVHTAYGPGSTGYVQQLKDYDAAFAAFFSRLDADGINKTNTLFVFTVDEGDHFVGSQPTPVDCDGINTPCDWTGHVGELNANIDTLVTNQLPTVASKFLGTGPNTFTVHGDDAPTMYLAKKGAGRLGQTDPDTRLFERSVAGLTALNPYTGNHDLLMAAMADQSGLKGLHMFTTGDLARNPTFAYFADADYFLTDFPASTCETCINPAFAWNHGDIQPEIAQTWLGFVGPGVLHQADSTVFTDHTDVRPTINAVLGLCDGYELDGRVITQALDPSTYASSLGSDLTTVESLGTSYKQINAPFGDFSKSILIASTAALQADDATYTSVEASIDALVVRRDALVAAIRTALDGATCHAHAIDPTQAQAWITQAATLVADTAALATSSSTSGGGTGGTGAGGSSGAGGASGAATAGAGGASGGTGANSGGTGGAASGGAGGASGGSATANLDVYRVGDGSGSLINTGNAVFIDEFGPDGNLVHSTPMPIAVSGTNHRLIASGTATSEGLITRSANGQYVVLTGYDADLGTSALAGTTGVAVPRVIGRLDAAHGVDTSTLLSDGPTGNNPRSVASSDGTSFWLTGGTGGVRFLPFGNPAGTASVSVSSTTANLRQIGIFAGQLYVSSSSGALRLGTVGVGLPSAAGQTTAQIAGFPTTGSPYGFAFADLDASVAGVDTLYVTDDSIGVTKYSLVAGAWAPSGTVGTAADAYRGVTVVQNGSSVVLFATRKGGSSATGGGELVTLVDGSGYSGAFAATPTVLATASANTAFRGVALAPM